MKSIKFPNMIERNQVQVVEDDDATLQNLKSFLYSEKGEFKFDPFFGIKLKRYLFEQNNGVLKDILIDEIYEQIKIFMPQLIIKRNDITITSDIGVIYCNIKCRNNKDFELNSYNLVLFNANEEE